MEHDSQMPTQGPTQVVALPTTESKRFQSLDVLRGFAMLGILVPNMVYFGWPISASSDPSVISDAPANAQAYEITSIFFLGKFMFLFAMLFGSGVIMYGRKFDTADEDGRYHTKLRNGAALWYWRCGWLMFFGLIHAYLFWYGDILSMYALAGLTLVWWLRRIRPTVQLGLGLVMYIVGTVFIVGLTMLEAWAINSGNSSTEGSAIDPVIEIAGYTGSYLDAFWTRLPISLTMTFLFGPLMLPSLVGIMLMGMGLTKLDVLTGKRSMRFYIVSGIVGLGIGLPATSLVFHTIEAMHADASKSILLDWEPIAQLMGIPISLGYAGFVIALSKCSWAGAVTTPLAAVGRMALTNYFLQTILCTTFFYGYGFGNFASIEYPQLWLVILSVWSINIVFSMLWLRFFTMGPFEWLWRVLTYRKLVPIRA